MTRKAKNRSFFKEWIKQKLEGEYLKQSSKVKISTNNASMGNMVGSFTLKPTKKNKVTNTFYKSYKEQWLMETGSDWPRKCSNADCKHFPDVGGHVFLKGFVNAFLVPLCQRCNCSSKKNLHWKQNQQGDGWFFPMTVRNNIPLLQLDDVNISDHVSFIFKRQYRRKRKYTSKKILSNKSQKREVLQYNPGGLSNSKLDHCKIIYGKKHQGKTLTEVWNTDPEYCKWILHLPRVRNNVKSRKIQNMILFRSWLKQQESS